MPDSQSAVERSLEDFIARANTTLPPVTPAPAPAARRPAPARRGGTMVVLGSQAPLAEETEIVTRLPSHELLPRRRSLWSTLRLPLAFLAGAAIVLVATRLISGGPTPVKPVPVAQPVTAAPPPIIVVPLPAAEARPPVAETAPEPAPAAAVPGEERKRPATRASRKPRPRPAAAKAPSSGGLVDPFAN